MEQLIINVLIIGPFFSGKTTISATYCRKITEPSTVPCLPTCEKIRLFNKYTSINGKEALIRIYDIIGTHDPDREYYKVDTILIVFDASDHKNIDNVTEYINKAKKYANINTNIILVANKCDLMNDFSKKIINDFSKKQKIEYIKTGFFDLNSIDNLFNYIILLKLSNKTECTTLLSQKKIPWYKKILLLWCS